jgi:transposase
MKVQQIIGADLSKETIDLHCHGLNTALHISNKATGFSEMKRWLKSQKIDLSSVMIVMEHTGLYSYHFERYLQQKHLAYCKVSALAIKKSLGLIRGKTDKIDAQRIARYGYEKQDRLQAAKPMDASLQRLKLLQSTRDFFVKHRASFICALKEHAQVVKHGDLLIRLKKQAIEELTNKIDKLDEEIQQLLDNEQALKTSSELLQSIVGVGPVISTTAIIKTGNFTLFGDARKFACYCGTAPFEHSSGKSIKGKTRISHLADKTMKTLLDQAAKSAIQHDPELKAYYQRRIQKGKGKRSTINIVRNKIIYRMFAVIGRGTPYKKINPMTAA